MVICLERGADLHMAQPTPLPLTVSLIASVKSRLVFPFWYRLTRVVPDKGPLNGCVCVCVCNVPPRLSLPARLEAAVRRPASLDRRLDRERSSAQRTSLEFASLQHQQQQPILSRRASVATCTLPEGQWDVSNSSIVPWVETTRIPRAEGRGVVVACTKLTHVGLGYYWMGDQTVFGRVYPLGM